MKNTNFAKVLRIGQWNSTSLLEVDSTNIHHVPKVRKILYLQFFGVRKIKRLCWNLTSYSCQRMMFLLGMVIHVT